MFLTRKVLKLLADIKMNTQLENTIIKKIVYKYNTTKNVSQYSKFIFKGVLNWEIVGW